MDGLEIVLVDDGSATPLRFSALAGDASGGGRPGNATERIATVEILGERIALAFSYEDLDLISSPEYLGQADVVLFFVGYGYAVDDASSALGSALAQNRFPGYARSCGAWLVAASAAGGYGHQVFCGSSFVLAPDGRLAACASAFEEELFVADIGHDIRLSAGSELAIEMYDERVFLWNALSLGLRSYVEKLGETDVVIALDGSLSSMALAALASDALGPTRVHALDCVPRGHPRSLMPAVLARTLRIDCRELDGAWAMLAHGDEALHRDVAQAYVVELAREVGGMVLMTEDKTELSLVPRTHRVMASAFAPLGDVYRIDVLDICRTRNAISPVFDRVVLFTEDLPRVSGAKALYANEVLLERIDDVLSMHVEGGSPLFEVGEAVGDASLAEAVLRQFAMTMRSSAVPEVLTMTTCPLEDYHLPHGFAWSDSREAEEQRRRDETLEALFGSISAPSAPEAEGQRLAFDVPAEMVEGSSELREALDLLRDLSLGTGADWRNPFSEN